MSEVKHHAKIEHPFADGPHTFLLDWDRLIEFERSHGPAFRLFHEMTANRSASKETIREVIRLALIGGGTKPLEALQLVTTYVQGYPAMDSFELALGIIEAALFGSPEFRKARGEEL